MSEHRWSAVILAAGEGKRMRSALPKVLHPIAGRPMIRHVLEAVYAAGVDQTIAVVADRTGRVRAALGPEVRCVEQRERRGTADAVVQAKEAAREATDVVVLSGDVPLIRPETLRAMMDAHRQAEATLTLLTAEPDDPRGLGRILRTNGRIAAIREEHDASEAERAIREVNAGIYCFDARWLWQSLPNVEPAPNGELYLTALVERAAAEGRKIEVVLAADWEESIGVNDREQLARAEAVYRRRMLRTLMVDCGVTIIDPATTYIDAGVEIAPDTTIEPNTHIRGHTRIGSGCTIGPNAMLRDARIGEGCRVFASCLEDCELEDGVDVGPYSHVRPGAHLEAGVHVGNYVEVKASRIGRDSKIGHFSYIGDALLGANVNIGAGTVTCNFDGERKHTTQVGDDAFIGSDTMLVAPVRIGRGARTGAGSVVTHDVAEGETVAGVPARGLRQKRAEGAIDGR